MKQAIVARADLGMGKGKLAAQVAHASLSAVEDTGTRSEKQWKGGGQKKIVLKANSEKKLFQLADEAERDGIPHAVVRDAGHTQLEPGVSQAVLAYINIETPFIFPRWLLYRDHGHYRIQAEYPRLQACLLRISPQHPNVAF
jgi:PTH2 family peptidyl-tRNA hydrolase